MTADTGFWTASTAKPHICNQLIITRHANTLLNSVLNAIRYSKPRTKKIISAPRL